MLEKKKNRRVRSLMGYLPAMIRFYGIKNEKLAAFIFLLMLSISFAANLFSLRLLNGVSLTFDPQNMEEILGLSKTLLKANLVSTVTFLLLNIVGSAYVYAFLRDIRGINYSFKECIVVTLKRLYKIVILSIILIVAVFGGALIIIVPGVIIYLMFIFANQYLMDQNRGIFKSIKASVDVTNGIKTKIFTVILLFNLLMFLFPNFVGANSGNLITAFVLAFIATIFNLMYHRLISLMYFELEYVYLIEEDTTVKEQ